jgi:hypothetical protein
MMTGDLERLFALLWVRYDSSLLDTFLSWHVTKSVTVIQQFVESVTCYILGHIYRQWFECVPFVKWMMWLSFESNQKAGCNFIFGKYEEWVMCGRFKILLQLKYIRKLRCLWYILFVFLQTVLSFTFSIISTALQANQIALWRFVSDR